MDQSAVVCLVEDVLRKLDRDLGQLQYSPILCYFATAILNGETAIGLLGCCLCRCHHEQVVLSSNARWRALLEVVLEESSEGCWGKERGVRKIGSTFVLPPRKEAVLILLASNRSVTSD